MGSESANARAARTALARPQEQNFTLKGDFFCEMTADVFLGLAEQKQSCELFLPRAIAVVRLWLAVRQPKQPLQLA